MLQVAGRELLVEEFFSLFELLHRLQQFGQVVDIHHGFWVLVPQLEAASSQVTKKNGITDFLNLRAAKKSGTRAINCAAGTSPNRIHRSFTPLYYLVFLLFLSFSPEVRDTQLACYRGLS